MTFPSIIIILLQEETVNAELKVGAGKVEDEQVEDEQVDEVWLTTPQCVQHSLRHTLPVHTAHWVTDKTLKTPSLRWVYFQNDTAS